MYTLGIHGGINTARRFKRPTPGNWLHDASCVLCHNGEVVAAAEEERFVRIKHVSYFPVEAIRYCLDSQGITLAQVEKIVFSSLHMNTFVEMVNDWQHGARSRMMSNRFHSTAAEILSEEFGVDVSHKLSYAGHHVAHALSAVCQSGFDESLCLVLDGWGDGLTGLIACYAEEKFKVLRRIKGVGPAGFYLFGTELLGYAEFDEYKVMGLAPYGSSETFGAFLDRFISLCPQGEFQIKLPGFAEIREAIGPLRRPQGEFKQHHKDWAASMQSAIERIVLHILEYFRKETALDYLCLAGGLAQNCVANGKILTSSLFKDVFVQPAAYDAGCSIGAAFHGGLEKDGKLPRRRIEHVYWGSDTPRDAELRSLLDNWDAVIDFAEIPDVEAEAAQLLAAGRVLGWVQGRAEFGARALGNRSILADPRPAENKDRINKMVKKREEFRPFAPSVLEEYLREYFEVPDSVASLPFMLFALPVRKPYRDVLKAVTHVDGTARIQSVSRTANAPYWRLIDEFRKLTGIPVVLNTSFNNNAEPIVNTPTDALNCYLSTGIDALIIGNFLITRRPGLTSLQIVRHLVPRMNDRFSLVRQPAFHDQSLRYAVHDSHENRWFCISRHSFRCLETAVDEQVSLQAALPQSCAKAPDSVWPELLELWEQRVFTGERTLRKSNRPI